MAKVVGSSKVVRVDFKPAADAYEAGDVVGTNGGATVAGGKIPIPIPAAFNTAKTSVLQSVTLYDSANQKQPLDLLFFQSAPAMDCADHAPPTGLGSAADGSGTYLGHVHVAATDWHTITGSDTTTAVATPSFPALVVTTSTVDGEVTNLHVVCVTQGTPTYGAGTGKLTGVFGFLQDEI